MLFGVSATEWPIIAIITGPAQLIIPASKINKNFEQLNSICLGICTTGFTPLALHNDE